MSKKSRYSENLGQYLQKKYSIISAGIFLAFMLVAAPALSGLGLTNVFTAQNEEEVKDEGMSEMSEEVVVPEENFDEDFEDQSFEEEFNDEEFTEDENFQDDFEGEEFHGTDEDFEDQNFDENFQDDFNEDEENFQEQSEDFQEDSQDFNQDPEESENFQEDFNEQNESVCGRDGTTYDSEAEAESANAEVEYFGQCGKAQPREIRDMEKQMKQWKFDFDNILKRAKRTERHLQKAIERLKKYLEKAEKNGINGEFKSFVEPKIAYYEAAIKDVKSNAAKVQKYSELSKAFASEAKSRLEKVKSGEKGSQHFWNYVNRNEMFWYLREILDRGIEPFDEQGHIDMEKEFVNQRFEAAKLNILSEVDFSIQNELWSHIEENRSTLAALIARLRELEPKIIELIEGPEMNWDDFSIIRDDISDPMQDIRDEWDEVVQGNSDFWESEPWKKIEKVWEQIRWAQESSFALKDLENFKGEIENAKKAIEILERVVEEPSAKKTLSEIKELIEKALEALAKVEQKVQEVKNPEIIWKFFDFMEKLGRSIDFKMKRLADLFYTKYQDKVQDEEFEVVNRFFNNGPNRDSKEALGEVIEFDNEDLKEHLLENIPEDLADKIIEKIVSKVSNEILELTSYDQERDIGLDSILEMSSYLSEGKDEEFKKFLTEKKEMSQVIAQMQEEIKDLKLQNTELKTQLNEIAAYNFYGDKAEAFKKELQNIDLEKLSPTEAEGLKKKFEDARESSKVAKFNEGFIPFKDTDDSEWFTKYVDGMKKEGVVKGFKDESGRELGEYRPGNSVLHAEFAKMVLEATHKGQAQGDPSNSNAKGGQWFSGYYKMAENLSLELANTLPSEPIQRKLVAKTIVELLGIPISSGNGGFNDVSNSDSYAPYIATVKDLGIMSGYGQGNNFGPDELLNRAEVAKVVNKFMEVLDAQKFEGEEFDIEEFNQAMESESENLEEEIVGYSDIAEKIFGRNAMKKQLVQEQKGKFNFWKNISIKTLANLFEIF